MKKILVVFGTRPEAIKMCPLVKELKTRPEIETVVCVSGQHREMLHSVLKLFDILPDYDLDIMKTSQTLFEITSAVLLGMNRVFQEVQPDIVLVHGDTTTGYAAALAAFYAGIKIGHVEAGLRTYHMHSPFPEEFNRCSISLIADFHFAPTENAKQNLLKEGHPESSVFVTGNTGIDALRYTVSENYTHPLLEKTAGSRLILLTAHRRENLGNPMKSMFRAIKRILDEFDDIQAIYPVHLNPAVRTAAYEIFGDCQRIFLTDPLDVLDFHNFLARSYLILTDSGGIQEEAPAFGKPVLVMRDTTERPEGVAAGTLKLVGTNEENIYRAFRQLLEDESAYQAMAKAKNPYGDGFASRRIADILLS